MTNLEKYAMDAAKEITISKVSNSTSGHTQTAGAAIGQMYTEIYKAVLAAVSSKESE